MMMGGIAQSRSSAIFVRRSSRPVSQKNTATSRTSHHARVRLKACPTQCSVVATTIRGESIQRPVDVKNASMSPCTRVLSAPGAR
jgi:hypothetical protein